MGLCDEFLYLGGNETETHKYVSELMGKETLDPGALLQLMEMEPIRVRQKYSPVRRWKSGDVWIYDIGQDLSGIANITFYGPRGSTYSIRYSDRLNDADVRL